jgi:hypothetical protein
MADVNAAVGDARFEVSLQAPEPRALEPTPQHLQHLLVQLSADESTLRCSAVKRLAESAHAPFLVEPLIALLADERRDVRRATISALAESGDTRARQPLKRLMKGGGSLAEAAGGALGQLERGLASREDDGLNRDAAQAVQTAHEIREATAVRRLGLRSEVRKGIRLKLVSLLLWGAGVSVFCFGVAVGGVGLAIVAGIALGLSGFALMDYPDRYMPAEGWRNTWPAAIPT